MAAAVDPWPDPCTCGSGPVVIRCPDGHVERVGQPAARPGQRPKVRCPHRDPGADRRCGISTSVSLRRNPAAAAELAPAAAAGTAGTWPHEAPPAAWLAILGDEAPTAERCADDCPCGQPVMRYTADHTMTACPDPRCAEFDCWDVSPAAASRAAAHQGRQQRPARGGQASPASQRAADEQGRQLRRQLGTLTREVRAQLADPRLSDESRDDLEWFAEQLRTARTPARAAELAAQLAELPVTYRHWWQRGQVIPGELDDDDDGELPAAPAAPALPAGSGPLPFWDAYDQRARAWARGELIADAARTGAQ
jgi:hypothetical protein